MTGSVYLMKDRGQWHVSWPWVNPATGKKKTYKITRYKGRLMEQTSTVKKKDQGHIDACRLLAQMQGDVESGVFRLEKYIGNNYTDVIPFFEEWLEVKALKKPATVKGYRSYFKIWIRPFFEKNPVQLHEIQLDTLDKLLRSIKLGGKGKHNVMMCFHAFMDYAWRARRVFEVPPFPKRSDYGIVIPTIKWLPSDRQVAIISAIPEEHQTIFWFLKFHLRRPGEACALKKIDYDYINKVFIIRRSVSARTVVDSTKTGVEHVIPCHDSMIPLMDHLSQTDDGSEFMFTNPGARKDGKRYTGESLNRIWKSACEKTGESIDMYSGLKHSSCSQFVNEEGMSISDLQMITDHARIDSVKRYAKTEVARKRDLMNKRNIADLLRLVKGGK